MARHVLIAFTNAVEGREDEFNEWYTNQHMTDVLRCPGFVRGQRFSMSDAQRSEPPPYKYMALYELATDDLADTLRDARTRGDGSNAHERCTAEQASGLDLCADNGDD
jgi:hypothetical protein